MSFSVDQWISPSSESDGHPLTHQHLIFSLRRSMSTPYPWVITFTASHRPTYTAEVLTALAQCRGVAKYLLLPSIEPGNDEVVALYDAISFARCRIEVNRVRLGCGANTLSALERGFAISDFVIHLEDDTVPTTDTLEYFEHCRATYRRTPDVFSVSGYPGAPWSEKVLPETLRGRYRTLARHRWFTPWGWATWRNRFKEMHYNWDPSDWDRQLNTRLRGTRFEVTPILSRIQNIGAHAGTNVPSPEWHRQTQFLPFWAALISIPGRAEWIEQRQHGI